METTIFKQGAQVRCYKCGSPEIEVICHHCGRPMCRQHGPVHPSLRWLTENREFTDLTLGVWPLNRTDPAHCEFHVHSSPNYRRIMILPGALVLLIGLWLFLPAISTLFTCLGNRPEAFVSALPALAEFLRDPQVYNGLPEGLCYQPTLVHEIWNLLRAGIVLLFGAAVIAVGAYLNRERVAAAQAGWRADVPLGPFSERLTALESLHALVTLDRQGQASAVLLGEVRGKIYPNFRFTPLDLQRIQEYRQKYGLRGSGELPFQAGFLLLQGHPLIRLLKPGQETPSPASRLALRYRPERENLFWLEGVVNRHPYLTGEKGRSNPGWGKEWDYAIPLNGADERSSAGLPLYPHALRKAHDWGPVPVRLVPLLMGIGNARRLCLELQFNRAAFPRLKDTPPADQGALLLRPDQALIVEELRVDVDPQELGRPQAEGVISEVQVEKEGRQADIFRIEWRNLWFPVEGQVIRCPLEEIRFERAIPPGSHLTGRMTVRIPALCSGIQRIGYFSALGYRIKDRDKEEQDFPFLGVTYLEVEFDLALTRLSQSEQVILRWKLSEDKELAAKVEAGGTPDPQRLRRFLDRLNTFPTGSAPARHMYVRRVVESTPQMAEPDSGADRWHWDITGRWYQETFPVDFHLAMYSERDAQGDKTEVEVTVQGQAPDKASQEWVQKALHELKLVVASALQPASEEARTMGGRHV